MKSIKTRLISIFLTLILIVAFILTGVSIYSASKGIRVEAEKGMRTIAEDGAEIVRSRLDDKKSQLALMAHNEKIQTMDWDIQKSELIRQLEVADFLDAGVGDLSGISNISNGTTIDISDRSYFKDVKNGEITISDLIINHSTEELSLIYSAPIMNDGEVKGIITGRSDAKTLSDIVASIQFGKTGYAFVVNDEGTTVGHRDLDIVLSQWNSIEKAKEYEEYESLGKAIEEILDNDSGISKYQYDGVELYAAYEKIEDSPWTFVIVAEKNEILKEVIDLRRELIVITLIILIISIIVSYFVGDNYTKPILALTEYGEILSNYDVSKDLDAKLLKREDEIGILSNSMLNIKNNLNSLIGEIGQSADQVAATAEESSAIIEENTASIGEVTKSIDDVSDGALRQAETIEESNRKVNLLENVMKDNLEIVETFNEASDKVEKLINNGLYEIENLNNISMETDMASMEIERVILKTDESANKIEKATELINSIAEQTNLLALNAAIEAARAGESGRGFSVVAEEIRKLAVESGQSSQQIEEIVKDLKYNSEGAVDNIKRVREIVEEQTISVENSKMKYEEIEDSMKVSENVMNRLNKSTNSMKDIISNVSLTMDELAAIAEETSASTEEVTSSMEEQTASMEEVAKTSESLAELAQKLQDIIIKFKI